MERVALALAERIEQLRSTEWQRLRRKTASLDEADRAAVEFLIAEVMRGIAGRTAGAVRRLDTPHAAVAVERLFGLPPVLEPPLDHE